ncbi:hypothetical protein BN2127_JRS10_00751 [Bacillus subtilis]|nr:hypothetical protein BN2127_JRS10_00751 [Bacillus subtilis]
MKINVNNEYDPTNHDLIMAKFEIYEFCKRNTKEAIDKNLLELALFNLNEMKKIKKELEEMKAEII